MRATPAQVPLHRHDEKREAVVDRAPRDHLGRRHADYGVTDAHYDTVGGALLWTLEKGLGSAFTPDVKAAWTTVYTVLATTMKAGAEARS